MRRTNSYMQDSDGTILPDKHRLRNKTIVQGIRNMTLSKFGLATQYQDNPSLKEGSVFKRLSNTLQRSIIPSMRKVCAICEMEIKSNSMLTIASCQHVFCENCSSNYLTYKINAYEEIVCPSEGCLQPLDKQSSAYKSLADELKRKHEKQERFEKVRRNPQLKLCTQKDCEGVVDTANDPCICLECKTVYCKNCMYAKHEGQCQLFQVEFLQDNYKFRQCSSCKNVIEKNQGCNHITCRCGHQFCYVCGADWDKDPCRGLVAAPAILDPALPALPILPQSCCLRFWKMTAKIFALPLWAIFGCLIAILAIMIYLLLLLLLACFGGPCEFVCSTIRRGGHCAKVLCLLLPIIYLVGIPLFFFGNCDRICDSCRRAFRCYFDILQNIRDW